MKLFDRLGKLRDRRRPYCTMIVPAAGESRRMGGGNKLLLPLEGEPVLAHTLRAIDAATLVDEIILSTRTECLAEMAELCRRCGLQKPVRVVVGGETRTHSVLAAALFGVPSPENVVFTMNATHGLNIAIRSLVVPGSRVVISGYEHNAVCRPLYAIPEVRLTVVDAPPFRREQAAEEFRRAILAGADAVIVNHVSNVFGCVQPLEEIAGVCRSRGVPLLVDASQSAGTLPLHLTELGAAFIAMPGHKGLYGPQGTGLLLCGERPARPLLLGGTGSASRDRQMPPTLPDRLEAGTHNMPGIAGLLEGLRFVRRRTPEAIACRERQLAAEAVRCLKALPGVEVFTPANGPHPTGVVSFRAAGRDCEELAEALGRRGIALRAGLHCAPLAHRTAGTLDTGTVRLSLSDFNTPAQIEKLAQELHQLFRETVR